MNEYKRCHQWTCICFSLAVNITMILYGYASGWTSSSLLILESEEKSPLVQGKMDQNERSWVTSLFAISGVAGTLIYYAIADTVGRKMPLWSVAVPNVVSIIIFMEFYLIRFNLTQNIVDLDIWNSFVCDSFKWCQPIEMVDIFFFSFQKSVFVTSSKKKLHSISLLPFSGTINIFRDTWEIIKFRFINK